jgi:exopolyphosphatase/guanosine-5'-triphosphate,3'-diphosphate pyrophosphatase
VPSSLGFGAAERHLMTDDAPGGDPGRDRPRGRRERTRWGRRSSRGFGRGGAARDRHLPTYAALDLGTNNCRLLIARPTADSFRVIDAFSRIIRLGEGVSTSGMIGEQAMSRAIEALSVCRNKMENRGVTRARLIATEACRAAGNCSDFLTRVRERVGIDLEIVDRETEARLAAIGCAPLVDSAASGVILFDIGGGSSELVRLGPTVAASAGPPLPQIRTWASLPLGVVTLAERYGGVAVDRPLFERMVADVAAFVDRFAAGNGGASGGLHMLGTSGTVTTIAGVHLQLPRYDRRHVDGCWMSEQEVSAVIERLLAMSYEERVANPCIGVERADLVLAGCAILEAIRRAFPCRWLRVADRGLREGMLVELMREDRIWDGIDRARQ